MRPLVLKAIPMTKEKRRYRSYLLRLWQVKDKGRLVWRTSLESPSSGERIGFGSLDELWHFLRGQTGTLPNEKKKAEESETSLQSDEDA